VNEARRRLLLMRVAKLERGLQDLRADLEDLAPSQPDPEPSPWDVGPYLERVRAAVGEDGFKGTRAELALAVSGKATRVREAVRQLFESGELEQFGKRIVRRPLGVQPAAEP